MTLTLTYMGTATEGRIALLLSMRRHGYKVFSPVSLLSLVPIIPSKTQAPLYIREGAIIPDADDTYNYVVPPGGLRLDLCEYTDIMGEISLLSGLPDWADLLEEVISLEVICYYRPQGVLQSDLSAEIGDMTDVPKFGNLLFPPVSGFGMSLASVGKIAEADPFEGFCGVSKYLWLLSLLPRPGATMYHPFSYDGGFWLPENSPVYRYNLWSKPYFVAGTPPVSYDWIVAHPDKWRDPVSGQIIDVAWSGYIDESMGWRTSLTSARGFDLSYGGYKFSVSGGYGSWLSSSQPIAESVHCTGIASATLPILAAPINTLYPLPALGRKRGHVHVKSVDFLGRKSLSVASGVYLRDETGIIIEDESDGGLEQ